MPSNEPGSQNSNMAASKPDPILDHENGGLFCEIVLIPCPDAEILVFLVLACSILEFSPPASLDDARVGFLVEIPGPKMLG